MKKLANCQQIFLLLLLIVMIMNISGCRKSQGNAEMEKKTLKSQLTDPNVSILYPVYGTSQDINEASRATVEFFEQQYGGKVNVTLIAPNEYSAKLISMVTADEAPDIVHITSKDMPLYAIKGLIQPIDPFIDMGDTVWKDNLKVMDSYVFKGSNYCISEGISPYIILFNKSLFENIGLKTPDQYYKEGNWNWEILRKLGMQLTIDTDKDGSVDQWGYSSSNLELFVLANNADYVKYEDYGNITIMLKDPKVIEALQFVQDGHIKDKYFTPKTSSNAWLQEFPAGKIAMVGVKPGSIVSNVPNWNMKYEWDIVPFPVGPSGEKDIVPANGGGWGISFGGKNPEGAAAWLYILLQQDNSEKLASVFSTEQITLIEKIKKDNLKMGKYAGIGNMNKLVATNLTKELQKGIPIYSVVESLWAQFQTEIDTLYK